MLWLINALVAIFQQYVTQREIIDNPCGLNQMVTLTHGYIYIHMLIASLSEFFYFIINHKGNQGKRKANKMPENYERIYVFFKKKCVSVFLTIVMVITLVYSLKKTLLRYLDTYLTVPDFVPDSPIEALYVLGGDYKSSYHHFKAASALLLMKKVKKIMILDSKKGVYTQDKGGRTITRNEWAITKLKNNGVNKEDVVFISVNEKFFGTLSEAKTLATYLKKNNLNSIILVCSKQHTRRVTMSFKHYLMPLNIQVYISASEDRFFFREMIAEVIKYFIYKILLTCEKMTQFK